MAVRKWYCKCGWKNSDRRLFVEHLKEDNPSLPLEDRHWQVSREEWDKVQAELKVKDGKVNPIHRRKIPGIDRRS